MLLSANEPAALMNNYAIQEPSFTDKINGDVGFIIRNRPSHIGSKKSSMDYLPFVDLNYGKAEFSIEDGIKYRLKKYKSLELGPIIEYRQSYKDKLPKGAHRMPDAYELGGYALYKTPVGELEARLRRALNSYNGWSGGLYFDTEANINDSSKVALELRSEWADKNFSDSFFGLKPKDADEFNLPRFLSDNYYSSGIAATYIYKVNKKVNLLGQVSFDRIYGENWRDPVIKTRNNEAVTIGITYHIGK